MNGAAPVPAAAPIRVFIVDDHENVRRGIEDLLETADDMAIVGEAGTAQEALVGIPALRPGVAVLDARLPDGNGIEVCREITAAMPDVRCLILTCFDEEETVRQAMDAGAAGFMIKEILGADLIEAIREIAAGRSLPYPSTC
jgi:DNA-binding NarL/FixJ family response regulator